MRSVLFLVPAALIAGCSSPAPEESPSLTPHPVTGKVVYDGKPAAGVIVTFLPTDAPRVPNIPRNPQGTTKEDGTFALSTFGAGDGAPEGAYHVLIRWPGEKNEKAEGEAQQETDKLMGWYDGTHSRLHFRVKSGPNTVPPFDLPKVKRPPAPSQGVPGRN